MAKLIQGYREAQAANEGLKYTPPKIKPSHKGLLHKNLGVPLGEKIPISRLEVAKNSKDPAVRKRATFAVNFRH